MEGRSRQLSNTQFNVQTRVCGRLPVGYLGLETIRVRFCKHINLSHHQRGTMGIEVIERVLVTHHHNLHKTQC